MVLRSPVELAVRFAGAAAPVIGGLWLWRLPAPWPVVKKRNGLMVSPSGNQARELWPRPGTALGTNRYSKNMERPECHLRDGLMRTSYSSESQAAHSYQ